MKFGGLVPVIMVAVKFAAADIFHCAFSVVAAAAVTVLLLIIPSVFTLPSQYCCPSRCLLNIVVLHVPFSILLSYAPLHDGLIISSQEMQQQLNHKSQELQLLGEEVQPPPLLSPPHQPPHCFSTTPTSPLLLTMLYQRLIEIDI